MAQVESVALAAESAAAEHRRELAAARRDAAQAAAQHSAAAASWHSGLDWHKAELSRCQRELARVEAERDRARDDARRCAPRPRLRRPGAAPPRVPRTRCRGRERSAACRPAPGRAGGACGARGADAARGTA